jgi:hypothetical protein
VIILPPTFNYSAENLKLKAGGITMLAYLSLLWSWLVKSDEIESAKNRAEICAQVMLEYFGLQHFLEHMLPIQVRVCWSLGHFIYVWLGNDETAPTGLKAIRIAKVTLKYKSEKVTLKVWLVASKSPID